MFTLLAHAGYSYDMQTMDTMSAVDHCMPIIVGAGVIIAALLGIILFILRTWQPKTKAKSKPSRKTSK